MKHTYSEWNIIIWNDIIFLEQNWIIRIFGIKMNEKEECSRSVTVRNVPLHKITAL